MAQFGELRRDGFVGGGVALGVSFESLAFPPRSPVHSVCSVLVAQAVSPRLLLLDASVMVCVLFYSGNRKVT